MGKYRARGIVRRTDVDDVGVQRRIGQRQKSVFAARGNADDVIAGNDICIDVGRIRRLHDEDTFFPPEDVQNIAQFIARAARDKHILRCEPHAASGVVAGDRFPQLRRAAFGHVAVERLLCRLIVHRAMQRLDHCRTERQRHIADAHAVQSLVRMLCHIRLRLLRDVVEQIGVLQTAIVHVGNHRHTSFK